MRPSNDATAMEAPNENRWRLTAAYRASRSEAMARA
jgi:hypothetical protein